MKKIFCFLFYLFISSFSFSDSEKYLKIALENTEYKCNPIKKTIKFEGIDFIGHLNENGKPYGEWYLKGSKSRQCFLETEKILDYKDDNLLITETENYQIIYGYGYEKFIYMVIKNKNKTYLYKKIDDKYKYITKGVFLFTALILYPDMVRILN